MREKSPRSIQPDCRNSRNQSNQHIFTAGMDNAMDSFVGRTLNRGGSMNDKTTPAESSSNPPQGHQSTPAHIRPGDRPLSYWAKKFLICNPFYLASAALLLFGLYRVSIDPNFLPEETEQLKF